jgi:hypothetical protein
MTDLTLLKSLDVLVNSNMESPQHEPMGSITMVSSPPPIQVHRCYRKEAVGTF